MAAARTPVPTRPEDQARRAPQVERPGPKWSAASFELPSRYRIPPEHRFSPYLALAAALFGIVTLLATFLPKEPALPPMIEVDLGIDGIENEPPPLGEPDAGAGEPEPAVQPEEPPMAEQPPFPNPIPPDPEPVPNPEPVPQPEPEIVLPPEPEPEPKPKPVAKPVTKPKPAPPKATATPGAARPATTQAGSGIAGAREGVRGSPGGKPGGRGGGRGDFVSTPQPQYDATARQRAYQGRGMFIISYSDGRITSVTAAQSTGVPYLDSRTITWIKTRWRVKSGTSGSASLPITWQLR